MSQVSDQKPGENQGSRGLSVLWICFSLVGLLAVVWATFFFILSDGGQENDEKFRSELFSLLDESKTVFNPTDRDRMLSDVIEGSMEKQYYDIAREAASFISMPMIRRGMYKRIAEHCMKTTNPQLAENCMVSK